MKEETKFTDGSGNIFFDIGLEDSDEVFMRAQIGIEVLKIIRDRKLKQREAATILGIKQTEVSHLMNGHFYRFSEGKLIEFLKKLDRKIMLVINQADSRQGISLTL